MPRQLRSAKVLVLVVALLIGYLLGAAHKRADREGHAFLPGQLIQIVITPLERGAYWAGAPVRAAKRSLRTRSRILEQNKRLRAEVLRLTEEEARLREAAIENVRLRAALELKRSSLQRAVLGHVIAMRPSRRYDTCTLDRGSRDGVERQCVVVTPRGLVGRVIETTPISCQALLLRDPSSGVGAMVQRSRERGVCVGQQSDTLLLNYLRRDADIHVGDIVITSGTGGVYPKGLVIGRVVRVIAKPADYLKSAEVSPSVKADTLEEAFVVLKDDG